MQNGCPKEVLDLESNSECLKTLRDKLRDFLTQAGLETKALESLLVAAGEAFTNAIRHSYLGQCGKKIQVTFEDAPDKVTLRFRDYGKKIDLTCVKEPTLPPVKGGGLGIYFMKTIVDEMEYNTRHSEGNELIMVKYKAGKKA